MSDSEIESILEDLSSDLPFIELIGHNLTKVPDNISRFTRLRTLRLIGNEIAELPDSIGNLTSLTSLNLSGNQLTELPDSIGNLTNLTSLNLSGNKLTWLPVDLSRCPLAASQMEGRALGGLSIDNNPFPAELVAASERGLDALWDFLRSNAPPSDRPPGEPPE